MLQEKLDQLSVLVPPRLSPSLLLSSLELSDTQVYEPYTRAFLGTATHFCEVGEEVSRPPTRPGSGFRGCGFRGRALGVSGLKLWEADQGRGSEADQGGGSKADQGGGSKVNRGG